MSDPQEARRVERPDAPEAIQAGWFQISDWFKLEGGAEWAWFVRTKRKGESKGSRRKITREVEDQIIRAMEEGATRGAAARKAGITRAAFYKHCETRPKFGERVTEACATIDDAVERHLLLIAIGRNPASKQQLTACIFWLKNRRPDDWKDRRENSTAEGDVDGYQAWLAASRTVNKGEAA